MLRFILKALSNPKAHASTPPPTGETAWHSKVQVWTEAEPERLRTFRQTTTSTSLGGLSVEITGTEELATDRQERFLRELGFPAEGITKHEATLRLTRILRPIDFALSETFKNAHELEKAHLRALQIALARWEQLRTFPRYKPERRPGQTGGNPGR
jgi:hypothetical protein